MLSELIFGRERGIVFYRPNEKGLTGGFLILPKKTAWIEYVCRMRKYVCSGQPKRQDIPVMLKMNIPRDIFNDSTKAVHEKESTFTPASLTGGAGGEVTT